MDRPVTSKSRGVCRYYTTPRGCFAGDNCKFLHGAEEKLTPYDKSKVCKFYARGHCIHGDRCWFRHVPDHDTEACCICLDQPTTYGLLTDCSHVFCLECIRRWRVPAGKSPDVLSSGTIKCCPLCRTPSRFVTPSAHIFPHGSTHKQEAIDAYKASMARVPCKFFDETSRTGKPRCPFGTDCFYQHISPDGTPHVFRHGERHSMNAYWRRRLRDTSFPPIRSDYDDSIEFLQHIFENPILDVIRASLPALMEGFTSSNGNERGSHDSSEEDEIRDGLIVPLESLEDNLVIHDEETVSLSTAEGAESPQSSSVESPPDFVVLSTQTPPLSETRAASEPQSTRLSSLFSTVMTTHSRQTLVIDISDDDEEEGDQESVQSSSDTGHSDSIELSDSPVLARAPVLQSSLEQQGTATAAPRAVANLHADLSFSRPQLEHDLDPPFMTDGRGRVVWSSTRNASGRSAAVEGRASRHSRTGSAPRIACPSPSSTFIVSNARGRAWSGQDAQGLDGKVGGGDQSNNMN